MQWQETSSNIWVLTLGNGNVKVAVFKPTYDRQHWHFSINGKDSSEGFMSLHGAKTAGLEQAIAQIDETLTQLEQARREAETALKKQNREKQEQER